MAYKSLDNILNEDSDTNADIRPMLPEPAEETGVTPQPEASEATEAEDAGPPPADERAKGQEAAIVAERRKRQEAEALVAQLRQEAEARNYEPPAPPPSIWEDEQGAFQHFGGQIASQIVPTATYQAALRMSEMLMMEQVPDFADVKQELIDFVGKHSAVNQQVAESPHPWRTAYQAYQNHRTMQELGATDIKTLEAKIREQILAEQQAQQPAAPRIPPSLSTTRSVSSRNGPAWSGPPALGDILK